MIERTTETKEVVTETVFCDVCKKQMVSWTAKCVMCNDDLCDRCSVHDRRKHDLYCPRCWGVGETYRKDMDAADAVCEEAKKLMEQEWAATAKEAKGKT